MKNYAVLQTHSVLEQSIYGFRCPIEPLRAIQNFAADIPWERIKRRGKTSTDSGRSYIHSSSTLQGVPELNELHRWMAKCLNEVRAQVGWREDTVRKLTITQSWLNRSDIGEGHHRHHHPLSLLSGILYLTEPSTTCFIVPSIYSLPTVIAPDKASSQLETKTNFAGQIGQFIVFPSTLKHEVEANQEPAARISMSINSWFCGAIGKAEELAYIPEQEKRLDNCDNRSSITMQ